MSIRTFHMGIVVLLALGACSKGDEGSGGAGQGDPGSAETAQRGDDDREGGDTVVVEMYSDAEGNYFKPTDIEVHRGDVVRWVLKSGVHNVNFPADSNAGKRNLPRASDMLQIPDQTYDLKIDLAEGRYYYQCDPHALLGMIGHIEVEDED